MSSEALERTEKLERIRYDLTLPCQSQFIRDDVEWLLAEVARLEQAVGDVTRERAVAELRLHRAEAALAVAREREQPMREAAAEALAFIDALALAVSAVDSREWNPLPVQFTDAVTTLRRGAEDALRAALADEPAAATLAEPGVGAGATPNAPGSASAAADEPGETP